MSPLWLKGATGATLSQNGYKNSPLFFLSSSFPPKALLALCRSTGFVMPWKEWYKKLKGTHALENVAMEKIWSKNWKTLQLDRTLSLIARD